MPRVLPRHMGKSTATGILWSTTAHRGSSFSNRAHHRPREALRDGHDSVACLEGD